MWSQCYESDMHIHTLAPNTENELEADKAR